MSRTIFEEVSRGRSCQPFWIWKFLTIIVILYINFTYVTFEVAFMYYRRRQPTRITYEICKPMAYYTHILVHINKVNSSIIIRIAHKSSFATINQWKYVIQMKNGTRFSVFLYNFFSPSSLNSYNKHSCNLFRILNAFLVIYHYVILIYEYNINRF